MPATRLSSLRLHVLVLLLLGTGVSRAQLVNGNFQTGDFTGWTVTNTPNGRTTVEAVVPFDTSGSGTPSLSAKFEAGKTILTVGEAGMEIYQNVTVGAGPLDINADIATSGAGVNADGGTFELLLNGIEVATHSFGDVVAGQTKRATLDYSGTVPAGTYEIEIAMLREFEAGTPREPSPFQYIDNVQLSAAPVPENTNTALLLALSLVPFLYLTKKNRGQV